MVAEREDGTMSVPSREDMMKAFREDLVAEALPVYETFTAESDRGAILVAAALLHDTLGRLLSAEMVPDKKARKDGLEKQGVLGTFGARIQVAYLFGLVERDHYDNLARIRRIRDECAHDVRHVTFASQKIRDLVTCLPVVPPEFVPPTELDFPPAKMARMRFLVAAATIYVVLKLGLASALLRTQIDEERKRLDAEIKRIDDGINAGRDQLAKELGMTRPEVDARMDALLASGKLGDDDDEAQAPVAQLAPDEPPGAR
jgi:DNA-binding MltR family transcriptional regulator